EPGKEAHSLGQRKNLFTNRLCNLVRGFEGELNVVAEEAMRGIDLALASVPFRVLNQRGEIVISPGLVDMPGQIAKLIIAEHDGRSLHSSPSLASSSPHSGPRTRRAWDARSSEIGS